MKKQTILYYTEDKKNKIKKNFPYFQSSRVPPNLIVCVLVFFFLNEKFSNDK